MKAAVIYQSKYGFTETYAKWIAQDLGAELLCADRVKAADLQRYDAIVYGGGLYAGGVSGIAALTKNFEHIKGKALYLFTVGAADVTDRENTDNIRSALGRVLTPQMLSVIKLYHLRGGIRYSTMRPLHRGMMAMVVKSLRKKPQSELSLENKMMLETYGQDVDFTDRDTIAPLVADVKTRMQSMLSY